MSAERDPGLAVERTALARTRTWALVLGTAAALVRLEPGPATTGAVAVLAGTVLLGRRRTRSRPRGPGGPGGPPVPALAAGVVLLAAVALVVVVT
ncbi:hypothetical protein INN71_12215 [Nocardioides sp. ChNu-153]|uniref:hypothetical protein n=1 Tax=Nocardioides sp. ChNu-153 TaxID=2779364 RepID=UPI00264F489C|nr:hypothetical protein [Nocardioides sp. ChNu-153]MDN7122154.1 hypothetical protein [Nocardioides sp. ChNu-153]